MTLLLLIAQAEGTAPEVAQPVTEGGNGRLWSVYQEEVLRLLAKPKSKRAERRRKARQAPSEAAHETLPSARPLEALQSDLAAERGRIDVLAGNVARIEAEQIRRKRNNEAVLLLLAA